MHRAFNSLSFCIVTELLIIVAACFLCFSGRVYCLLVRLETVAEPGGVTGVIALP